LDGYAYSDINFGKKIKDKKKIFFIFFCRYRTVILISIPLTIHICSEKKRGQRLQSFDKLRSHGFTRINEDKTIKSVNLLGHKRAYVRNKNMRSLVRNKKKRDTEVDATLTWGTLIKATEAVLHASDGLLMRRKMLVSCFATLKSKT